MHKRVKMGECIKVMNVQHEKESTLHIPYPCPSLRRHMYEEESIQQ